MKTINSHSYHFFDFFINNSNFIKKNHPLFIKYPFLFPFLPIHKNVFKITPNKFITTHIKNEIINFNKEWTIKDPYSNKWKSITLKGFNGLPQDF